MRAAPLKLSRMSVRISLCLLVCWPLLAACTGEPERSLSGPVPDGPAHVEVDAVGGHAAQFDEDLAERPAGSQQEFAAATYLTGHLQRAGYEVRLESVPFKDTVRSTNVVALTPGGGDPQAVVTVAYDTTSSAPPLGQDLGVFLELARALRVKDPDHNVEFVALGAELTITNGGNLGSRALARDLQGLDDPPPVITVMVVPGGGFRAPGPMGDELNAVAAELEVPLGRPLSVPIVPLHLKATEIFDSAGIGHAIAAGGIEEIGMVLLEYLSR
ncbi:MAG: hypothetical protein ACLGIB_09030 [Actinomycetota bacterium]